MAGSSNRTKRNTKSSKTGSTRKRSTGKRLSAAEKERLERQYRIREEIVTLLFLAFCVLLTLCNFKLTTADGTKSSLIGSFGNVLSGIEFGIFGWMAYVAPILLFFAVIFSYINEGLLEARFKLWAGIVLFVLCEIVAALIGGIDRCGVSVKEYYAFSKSGKGGGIIGALLGRGLHTVFGMVGTIVIILILMIICLVVMTEKSFLRGVRSGSRKVYETARDDAERRREASERRREGKMLLRMEQEDDIRPKRADKRVSGVILNTLLERSEKNQDIHELKSKGLKEDQNTGNDDYREIPKEIREQIHKPAPAALTPSGMQEKAPEDPLAHIRIRGLGEAPKASEEAVAKKTVAVQEKPRGPENSVPAIQDTEPDKADKIEKTEKVKVSERDLDISEDIQKQAEIVPKKEYVRPPHELLKKGDRAAGRDSEKQLKETALHLQETLKTFGVNVTITDISQGPAVTRYELQPEQGVKVSKIVGLSDDIKLNLAATDIRIEAPIPGKAAIGIEVPNKENAAVAFRDLIDSPMFEDFDSKLAFAVGKDIAGQTVVTDIAKMPHLLIAGATGSGKSVCINTLIMSILFKASPEEVKLIMIDPKVVELSVYNGIPHLMIPVVTDPKKAAGALHWGVAEMTERYKKFADLNVRKLDEYNKKVDEMVSNDGEPLPKKMEQIVIIVDELADLMMVAPGEVEESICRLAQLARAAGIHLVIATQRPSVDVITGLIKANMPSRIAFAVSSGVDSRTILDMNGAEKLLGKGDMLFYPQGMAKPVRVQGAFVSDKEVSQVVEFLKSQCGESTYSSDVEEKITAGVTAAGAGVFGQDAGSERDVYFYDAGTFIIEKDKASIGMLQRVFKIGFNRAARIMDQLAEAGVVGEEEGTKPRKVLMTQEQFEELVNS
ncbi:MAG: DNA translocase FtsK [Lachnospiraceae bacterium]|nr:DNA translocase FtsK [Lachnospiraceae bacterium]